MDADARTLLDALAEREIRTQLWVTGGGGPTSNPEEQSARVAEEAARIRPIAEAADAIGCTVGLYNHGGWFGEPENQLEVLDAVGMPNVGLVYNLHHGHGHLDRFPELLERIGPHLLALNLNGTDRDGEARGRKILVIGEGEEDARLIRAIIESGFDGPIGILGHVAEEDAEARLRANLEGLEQSPRRTRGPLIMVPMLRKLTAEALGTYALVFAGTGAVVVDDVSGGAVTHVGVSLTFGLIVLALIQAIGDLSGCHINSAVTIGFWAAGRFPMRQVAPYIACQCLGAIAASLTLRWMFPEHGTLGATIPVGPEARSFVLEIILTFLLMFVVLRVTDGSKEKGPAGRGGHRRGRGAGGPLRGADLRRLDEPGAFGRPRPGG